MKGSVPALRLTAAAPRCRGTARVFYACLDPGGFVDRIHGVVGRDSLPTCPVAAGWAIHAVRPDIGHAPAFDPDSLMQKAVAVRSVGAA